MRRLASIPLLSLIIFAHFTPCPNVATAQTTREEWRARDEWQRAPTIVAALGLSEGAQVADVGAGSGYFTLHLSRAVGERGRVFAVEISARALEALCRLVNDERLGNVDVIQGQRSGTSLRPGSVDAALVLNAYHEMIDYGAMLATIHAALRPGGRLVIVDNAPRRGGLVPSRDDQTTDHELSADFAENELRQAGFEIVDRVDPFLQVVHPDHEHVQWMIVARRPHTGAQ